MEYDDYMPLPQKDSNNWKGEDVVCPECCANLLLDIEDFGEITHGEVHKVRCIVCGLPFEAELKFTIDVESHREPEDKTIYGCPHEDDY